MRSYMHILLLLLAGTVCVSGCGMVTHSLIAHRALSYFYEESVYPQYISLLNSNVDHMIAGAPFPDYLYTCGADHDAGEVAHWPPWHAAGANYIRTFPRPWTEQQNALVAFLFGAVSHYIADLNWHGLGNVPFGWGFIQSLGLEDFECVGDLCSSAHSAADTGGEFVAKFASDLDWFHPDRWQVPADDLINIFARVGKNVTKQSIENCRGIFIAGSIAIKYLSELIFPLETDKAPFLVDEYVQQPLGGVDDMAVWSTRMWDRFAEWIENGPPNPPPPTFDEQTGKSESFSIMGWTIEDEAKWAHAKHGLSYRYKEMLDLVAPLALSSPFRPFIHQLSSDPSQLTDEFRDSQSEALRQHIHAIALKVARNEKPANEIEADVFAVVEKFLSTYSVQLKVDFPTTPQIMMQTHISAAKPAKVASIASPEPILQSILPLEYLGDSIVTGDFDADGKADLASGAWGHTEPGQLQAGAVYLQLSSLDGQTLTLYGSSGSYSGTFGRFGWSQVVLDFNADGFDDLVISAPLAQWNWTAISQDHDFYYRGQIFIFFGGKNFTNTVKSQLPADVTITALNDLTFLGSNLFAVDINGDGVKDLVSAAPMAPGGGVQRGSVLAFFSSAKRVSGLQLTDAQSDFFISTGDEFAAIGSAVDLLVRPDGSRILLLGAARYRSPSGTVGRVYGLSLPSPLPASLNASTANFSITGFELHAKFGAAVSVGFPYPGSSLAVVAISAPHSDTNTTLLAKRSGAIYFVDVSNLSGDHLISSLPLLGSHKSSDLESRCGMVTSFDDVDGDGVDDFIFAAPLYMDPNWLDFSMHEIGRITIYKGSAQFPSATGAFDAVGNSAYGRFGSAFVAADLNGDGQKEIIIGQPRAYGNKGAVEMSGAVWQYSL